MKIEIDRSAPFSFTRVGVASFEDSYTLKEQPGSTSAISTLDTSKLSLRKVFEAQGERVVNPERQITENLDKARAEGCLFLDAKVLETLLLHPELFPLKWKAVADSDSMSEESGSIHFDGTSLTRQNDGKVLVLAPIHARGVWEYGHDYQKISPENEALLAGGNFHLRIYTAVLEP